MRLDNMGEYLKELKRIKSEASEKIKTSSLSKQILSLFFFAVIGLSLPIALFLLNQRQDIRLYASDNIVTEFGFNTHLNAAGSAGYVENLNLDFFKRTVDDLANHNQKWIRINIAPWEAAVSENAGIISWNQDAMLKYDEAVNYAKSKGLKILLVTSVPDYALSYSDQDYTQATARFHSELANRYKGKIDIWQIYNEPDAHHFKGYRLITSSEVTTEYLDSLKTNFAASRDAIKQIDPNVKFTSNVTGFPLTTETFNNWQKFFGAIASELDIISLDIYTQNQSDISLLKNAVGSVLVSYNKPVLIAETGAPTADGRFTEANQADLMVATINELKSTNPLAIIFYEYADTIPDTNKTESSFGIVNAQGTPKSSYEPIMAAMQSISTQTGGLTPTPSPTHTPTPPPPTPTPSPTPAGDTTAPTVKITKPSNGSKVSRDKTTTIEASASDPSGISKVEFYVNDVLRCSDSKASYKCSWKVPKPKGVIYNLVAKAYDKKGNIGISTTIVVTSK